jgi:hypothetical protein
MRRLECCWFPDSHGVYGRLSRVLELTARKHCAGWAINVEKIKPVLRPSPRGEHSHSTNTAKLAWWSEAIAKADDGDEVMLSDADAFIVRPLDPAWGHEFDVAYTVKSSKYPFNGGVVFVRISPRTKAFIQRWHVENDRMFDGDARKQHARYHLKYAGMNQASFGALLENNVPAEMGVNLLGLPCSEYNCEDTYWKTFRTGKPRLVHVKSDLRKAVFGQSLPAERMAELRPVAEAWKALDNEASELARASYYSSRRMATR